MRAPFSVYSTWGLQDELGDKVELSEALARKALESLRRWRDEFGVQQDYFALDAFWFDPIKGYRHFKKPHWPNGFDPLVEDILALGMTPGLWYSTNGSMLQVPEWQESLAAGGGSYSLADGPYADELQGSLIHAAEKWNVRFFKFDFANFFAAAAWSKRAPEETYRLSVARFKAMLRELRARFPDIWVITHCGFARNHGLSTPGSPELLATDPALLEAVDATFSADPQPWDVPQTALVRNIDLFQDHQVWKMHAEGFPMRRVEDHGIIVGTTNTCFYRGRAGFRRSHLAQLARGGGRDMIYGDPSLLVDADLVYLRKARELFFDACNRQLTTRLAGGEPGVAPWHAFITGGGARGLCYVVNPQPSPQVVTISIPCLYDARLLFYDGVDRPAVQSQPDQLAIHLGPEQMALVGLGDYADAAWDLGAEADSNLPRGMRLAPIRFVPENGRLVGELTETLPSDCMLHVVVEVRDHPATGIWSQPHRFGGQNTHDTDDMTPKTHELVAIRAFKNGVPLEPIGRVPDVPVWSGISWVAATFRADATLRIEIEQHLPEPKRLMVSAYVLHRFELLFL